MKPTDLSIKCVVLGFGQTPTFPVTLQTAIRSVGFGVLVAASLGTLLQTPTKLVSLKREKFVPLTFVFLWFFCVFGAVIGYFASMSITCFVCFGAYRPSNNDFVVSFTYQIILAVTPLMSGVITVSA